MVNLSYIHSGTQSYLPLAVIDVERTELESEMLSGDFVSSSLSLTKGIEYVWSRAFLVVDNTLSYDV